MKMRMTQLIAAIGMVMGLAHSHAAELKAERVYLTGKGPSDAIEWDFLCSKGRKSGEWTKINVPSNWEQEGFGNYNYGHDPADQKHDETGTYRTKFMIPADWKDQYVRLVFEGSMTETSIKINGQSVGFPNFGGYLPFRYVLDKTNVKYGEENTLEVLVKKKPDNYSLDQAERQADYWVFGGIYRPVYLEVQPKEFINRVAIDAKADGSFAMDVFPQIQHVRQFRDTVTAHADEVTAQIQTLDGVDVGQPLSMALHGGAGRVHFDAQFKNPALWSPEYPNLYQVKVTVLNEGTPLSEKTERFGFRTFEMKEQDGLYLNGHKLMIQGVNRNGFDAKYGRALDADKEWAEARAIKAMNVNLVRSHLPPTFEFMRACDELGMMVITELCNWHDPYIDTPIARNIAYELVTSYQNYPSVILWANGNENGFNLEIDELYPLYDIQKRPVIHPWGFFDGIDAFHYPKFDDLQQRLAGPNIYLPTEFLHGLYDGGHGAGMEDFWSAMKKAPLSAGGVVWCWADAAIERTDKGGLLDTDGNHSADGIVGPNGEKEASYYSLREIWSPIQIALKTLPADFKGVLPVENDYAETSLSECNLHWVLLQTVAPFSAKAMSTEIAAGDLKGPSVKPGKSGKIKLPLPKDWRAADVLELTATHADGREIMKWSWATGEQKVAATAVAVSVGTNPFEITAGPAVWSFSPENGQLKKCVVNGKAIGLGAGPVLYAGNLKKALTFDDTWTASVVRSGDSVVVESSSTAGSSFCWTLSADGSAKLDYSFAAIDEALAYCAVGFDLADAAVESKRWLGQGPHRIWGNRLRGAQFGLWENEFNDMITGASWGQPEFKGIFGNVDWMQLNLKSGAALLVDTVPGASVGVLLPKNAAGQRDKHGPTSPVHAWWHYPEAGGLHLFHKLPGTGTKFANAEQLGPQGEPTVLTGPITGQVEFRVK